MRTYCIGATLPALAPRCWTLTTLPAASKQGSRDFDNTGPTVLDYVPFGLQLLGVFPRPGTDYEAGG